MHGQFIFESDTTGEKLYEEFHTSDEKVIKGQFTDLGFVNFKPIISYEKVQEFLDELSKLSVSDNIQRSDLLQTFKRFLKDFNHIERNSFLNSRM